MMRSPGCLCLVLNFLRSTIKVSKLICCNKNTCSLLLLSLGPEKPKSQNLLKRDYCLLIVFLSEYREQRVRSWGNVVVDKEGDIWSFFLIFFLFLLEQLFPLFFLPNELSPLHIFSLLR